MAVSAVRRLVYSNHAHSNQGAPRLTQAGRLCPSPKVQNQAAFRMSSPLAMRVWKRALRISWCVPTGISPDLG